jgi:hypothetical protein
LSALHAANFEKSSGGSNIGATGDPVFANPGNGHLQAFTTPIARLSAYDISGASAAHKCGVDLTTCNVTPATTDIHGNASIVGGVYDAGVDRYGSVLAANTGAGSAGFSLRERRAQPKLKPIWQQFHNKPSVAP